MTKSRGIGRGKHGNHKAGPGRGKHGKQKAGPGRGNSHYKGPQYYLHKYKTTERPRPCQRCGQNAYYYHQDFWYLCAAHLLDLINIGEVLWFWDDYPEMWDRTEKLLRRPAPPIESFTSANDMDLETRSAAGNQKKQDGYV